MPVVISISDDDIALAQSIVLNEGDFFDDERKTFIKDLRTLDLQASPGSGKTTSLLAKLLILDRKIPLLNGRGVLVLSHTNAAVNEIKERLGQHCNNLFSAPNFVGTIQSFVDTFLCVPAYVRKYGQRPTRIDTDVYFQQHYMPYQSKGYFIRKKYSIGPLLYESRLTLEGELCQNNGSKFPISSGTPTYQGILNLKKSIREKGILCYDEAYTLGESLLNEFPKLIKLLRRRFAFVFVDEMQDMDQRQQTIIDQLFHQAEDEQCVLQRIGDINQGIFSESSSANELWKMREPTRSIKGSHRLTSINSVVVNKCALHRDEEFVIEGRREGELRPTIFVYDDNSVTQVLQCFSNEISSLIEQENVIVGKDFTVKAVGAIREHAKEIAIKNYLPTFDLDASYTTIRRSFLSCYIYKFKEEENTFKGRHDLFLKAFLTLLRIEKVHDDRGRFYNRYTLLNHLRQRNKSEANELKDLIFQASQLCIKGDFEEAIQVVRAYIPKFLNLFDHPVKYSKEFISNKKQDINVVFNKDIDSHNSVNYDGFDIHIETVHAVKGQTHDITLYLDTYFDKKYDSEHVASLLLDDALPVKLGVRFQRAAKLMYVGLSRATQLVCFAVHRERYDKLLSEIDTDVWNIIEVGKNSV